MIRVFSGTSSLSSTLNSFHSQVTVTDGKFAVNSAAAIPPDSNSGVFGTDKADPQPTFYPLDTTFFIRSAASKPLRVGLNVGSTYLTITPGFKGGKSAYSVTGAGGYSGSVLKVFNDTGIEVPLDPSLFVEPPKGNYYLRIWDDFDKVILWKDDVTGLDQPQSVILIPPSLGLTTAEGINNYRGVVRVLKLEGPAPTLLVSKLGQVLTATGKLIPWNGDLVSSNNAFRIIIIEAS